MTSQECVMGICMYFYEHLNIEHGCCSAIYSLPSSSSDLRWQNRIEGIQSSSRCDSRQGPSKAGLLDAQSRLGRAISWKPALMQQSVSPSAAFATASSRHVSWVPATASMASQEATSISVKVVRQASWTPARVEFDPVFWAYG
ncbi:hypothetical protein AK812_SmicGene26491 [Symbiodinium microadriaticum]|uniref:Uncharacterized protein n=1 Tax=Symbiodinium microadriaticum TaxID=2951 RepID=A0A1Q9D9C2_SYMMI|nr:hypothetical protein AK812_SmicGene26491 [Symbiodinium microadriaticum]